MHSYSVVITTHKRPQLLRRAITSVKSQQHSRTQIVLVSDTPCSDTHAIASELLSGSDLFIQRAGQPGPAESRNLGQRAASGAFVIFLDDDDAFSGDFLANAERHATADAVLYTDYDVVFEQMDERGILPVERRRKSLAEERPDDLHVKNFIPPACLIYPRALIHDLAVDPSLVLNEDWDFLLAVMARSPLQHVAIDGPVVHTRIVADNRGGKNDHLLVETYRTIYKNRPAPTADLKKQRQDFFASIGLEAELADL